VNGGAVVAVVMAVTIMLTPVLIGCRRYRLCRHYAISANCCL